MTALSSSRLRIDWTDSQSTILGYRVYTAGTTSYIARTIAKTFTDFQLPPSTERCYTVTLVDSAGESTKSAQTCGTTLAGVPTAQRGVAAAVIRAGQVTVRWDAVGNATSYRPYYAQQAGITGTSRNISSLPVGTIHYFIVTAINNTGDESVESIEVSAIP